MHSCNLDSIIALRHRLHQYPELSMEEEGTIQILTEFLKAYPDFRICQREGWFYAIKEGKAEGRRIAFRADMDALPIQENDALPYCSCRPGVSHKCGHDGHSAALCGLAAELSGRETENSVCLVFQPGEETGRGAALCREVLAQEQIEEIYAFHNLPGYPLGSLVYREGLTQPASQGLRLELEGKYSHASAPEKGINPAEALAKLVLLAGGLEGRPGGEMQLCTVTGLKLGDGDFGISPGSGRIDLTLRAEREEEMDRMCSKLLAAAEDLAKQTGLKLRSEIWDRFPETRNHPQALAKVREAAAGLGLPLIEMKELWRASEDFGHYLKICPGAIFYLGAGEDAPALHTAYYDFDDRILESAVDIFVSLAQGTPIPPIKQY